MDRPPFNDNDPVFDGFSRNQLKAAFRMVTNPDDWRARIDAEVHLTAAITEEQIARAVAFFTGTEATIERRKNNVVRVTAVGYRMGPAGP